MCSSLLPFIQGYQCFSPILIHFLNTTSEYNFRKLIEYDIPVYPNCCSLDISLQSKKNPHKHFQITWQEIPSLTLCFCATNILDMPNVKIKEV